MKLSDFIDKPDCLMQEIIYFKDLRRALIEEVKRLIKEIFEHANNMAQLAMINGNTSVDYNLMNKKAIIRDFIIDFAEIKGSEIK